MMANYLYLPVPSAEMLELGGYVLSHWSPMTLLRNPHLQGWKKGASRLFGGGCLRVLRPEDKLFLLMHACHNATDAGASRHPQLQKVNKHWEHNGEALKVYSAAQLASVLEKEGLPRGFRNLYCCTCRSAIQTTLGVDPFAQRLYSHLRLRYRAISVTGFLGFFSAGPPGVYVTGENLQHKMESPDTITVDDADVIHTYSA
jgi:hypothetical protein